MKSLKELFGGAAAQTARKALAERLDDDSALQSAHDDLDQALARCVHRDGPRATVLRQQMRAVEAMRQRRAAEVERDRLLKAAAIDVHGANSELATALKCVQEARLSLQALATRVRQCDARLGPLQSDYQSAKSVAEGKCRAARLELDAAVAAADEHREQLAADALMLAQANTDGVAVGATWLRIEAIQRDRMTVVTNVEQAEKALGTAIQKAAKARAAATKIRANEALLVAQFAYAEWQGALAQAGEPYFEGRDFSPLPFRGMTHFPRYAANNANHIIMPVDESVLDVDTESLPDHVDAVYAPHSEPEALID